MRLSSGGAEPPGTRLGGGEPSPATVAQALALGLFAVLVAGWFVGAATGLFADPGHVLLVLPVLAALCYGLVWLALRGLRHAAWLDGTVLWVRGPFRTRGCDLATARVLRVRRTSVWGGQPGPVPTLVVARDDDGHGVRYPLLTSAGRPLPLEDRERVADAIDAGVSSEESRAVSRELRRPDYLDIDKPFRV